MSFSLGISIIMVFLLATTAFGLIAYNMNVPKQAPVVVTEKERGPAAPQTVASFVFLAEHKFFDGTFFHRVVDSIDVVQGGDPTGTGSGGPGYSIPDELKGGEHYAPGSVAMANAGPNTGGSQFFLITGPGGANLDSNPNYTIFGHITDGLDVAKQINGFMPKSGDGQPTQAVYIDSVTIETHKTPSPTPSPSG